MSGDVPAENPAPLAAVERMFPFVLKAKALLIGRDTLRANKGKLHFVLITTDIAETSRAEVLRDFSHYPVVQHYTGADFERFFAVKGAKAIGFAKSGLAKSIFAELKPYRINQPLHPAKPSGSPPTAPSEHKAS
jgi:hypothetical protein